METDEKYEAIAEQAVLVLGINPDALYYGVDLQNKEARRTVTVSSENRRFQKRAAHRATRRAFKGNKFSRPGSSWAVY